MPARDAGDRSLIAQIAIDTRWAHEPDRIAATEPMRRARKNKYLDKVDPDRLLPEAERERRAESLMRADMRRLALKSAQARRARAAAKGRRAERGDAA